MANPPFISMEIVNLQQLQRDIRNLSLGKRRTAMNKALRKSGLIVARNAQKQMLPNHGGPAHPTRLTSRTGTGRRSIRADKPVARDPIFFVDIGPNVGYMSVHELGQMGFPERRYLRPGLDNSRLAIQNTFVNEWRRSLNNNIRGRGR